MSLSSAPLAEGFDRFLTIVAISGSGLWYGVVWTLARWDLEPPPPLAATASELLAAAALLGSLVSRDFLLGGRDDTGVLANSLASVLFSGLSADLAADSGGCCALAGDFCGVSALAGVVSSDFCGVAGWEAFCGEVVPPDAGAVVSSFGPATGDFFSSALFCVAGAGAERHTSFGVLIEGGNEESLV